jgi:hypothetical protein
MPRRDQQHDHRECGDESCPRYPCRIYKDGYVRGYAEGAAAGYAAGQADGLAEGYQAGIAAERSDG